ncbi:cell wall anchor protein [Haemophilus parainfluenzae]|uniref:Cell wall anchor protein n=1 Tax=Haemophilus parainfluenzae TaxID=729 RepID=A0A369Z339_HAEPA|nr:cell wall anchor protein [Haemophilus parainfluenzae]RDE89403.1 cell wall anchor protein [Haemophilus parainfluenzae]
MSKNISVKINNGNKTIETVKLNSANQKVIIKAQPHVNYELVDEATQYAPEMIDTKRVGNDLHIAFEGTDINKESDLVLEGYYEHDNTELVLGMAEDGQYYAYVPQSGVESDAVTLLADQVFAPQALGGNSVTAPFWAFNPSWLWVAAGVAAVGGIIAAASGSHGSGSSNNANNNSNTAKDTTAPAKPTVEAKDNGSVEVTPPADADAKSVEVNYTDEAGTPKTATLTKGNDGNWTSNNPDVALDPATGKATIPADKVQDGSPVKAKATDESGNTGEEGTANAGNNVDHTVPNAPEVTSSTTDGSVTVQVPSNAKTGDMVEVTITPDTVSGNATPITVTLTKQADGSWTSDNESAVPNVKAGENSSIIPEDKVEDLSKVTVVTKDAMGNVSNKVETTAPLDPAKLSVNEEGKVVLTLPKQVNEGDLIRLNAVQGGDPSSYNGAIGIEFYKTATGWDIYTGAVEGERYITKVDEYTYILNNLKPTSKMSAQHIEKDAIENFPNNADNESPDTEKGAGFYTISDRTKGSVVSYLIVPPDNVPPGKPTISTNADGSVNISPPTDPDVITIEVNYIDENGNPQNAVLTRDVVEGVYHYNSRWTSNNPDVKVDFNGEVTISADKVKDVSEVTAKVTDASGNTGDVSIYETGVQHGSNTLDMGSGNDIVRISNDITPKASINGGDGFDTFEFVNHGKAITTTISMISNFEKIDMKSWLHNSVTISASDVARNHSAQATVDDSGKSHNNVLIVDGREGDKVNLSEISKTTSSKVTYEGNTYNVYNTGSNELWVDSDITVA